MSKYMGSLSIAVRGMRGRCDKRAIRRGAQKWGWGRLTLVAGKED